MRPRLRQYAVPATLAALITLGGPIVRAEGDIALAEVTDTFDGSRTLVGSYLAGRLARGQNDTENAASFYRSALERDPGNELLLEQAFQMEAMDGASPRAFKLAEDLIAVDPQHRTARLFLGLKEFRSGNYLKSGQHFRSSSTGPIGELTSAMALAWVEAAKGNFTAAMAQLDSPKQAEWAQFYLRYHKALIADLAGRRQDARNAFEKVFRQDPKTLRTTLAFARHAAHAGDIKLARSVLALHIEKNGGEAHPLIRSLMADIEAKKRIDLLVKSPSEGLSEAFYGLGEALIGEGAVPAGTLYMQMALSVEPEQQFALAALANAYESSRRYADAIAVYDRIPKGSALELPIEIRKAYNLNSLDRTDEARQTLSSLLERMEAPEKGTSGTAPAAASSGTGDAAVSREAPLKLGSSGDRVRELQEALARQGYDIGTADGRFGDATRRAVKAFQKSKKLEADGLAGPETVAAILGAGAAAAASPAETLPGVTFTDKLQVLDALGSIQRSRKLYAESTDTYSKAIALIPKVDKRYWTFFYARGTSYERLKNWQAAEADLQKALELAPDQPLVLNYLGYSWIDQGLNLKQGMALIEKAVALKPDDGYIVDSLGWAHFKLGNYKEAVRYLERAVELKPDDPILNDHLGDALWRVGREREAHFQWDEALSLNPEPEDADKIKQKLATGLISAPEAAEVKKTTEIQSAQPPKNAE